MLTATTSKYKPLSYYYIFTLTFTNPNETLPLLVKTYYSLFTLTSTTPNKKLPLLIKTYNYLFTLTSTNPKYKHVSLVGHYPDFVIICHRFGRNNPDTRVITVLPYSHPSLSAGPLSGVAVWQCSRGTTASSQPWTGGPWLPPTPQWCSSPPPWTTPSEYGTLTAGSPTVCSRTLRWEEWNQTPYTDLTVKRK